MILNQSDLVSSACPDIPIPSNLQFTLRLAQGPWCAQEPMDLRVRMNHSSQHALGSHTPHKLRYSTTGNCNPVGLPPAPPEQRVRLRMNSGTAWRRSKGKPYFLKDLHFPCSSDWIVACHPCIFMPHFKYSGENQSICRRKGRDKCEGPKSGVQGLELRTCGGVDLRIHGEVDLSTTYSG